jgi:hypothetical protein
MADAPSSSGSASSARPATLNLKSLDLRSLPADDAAPSETQLRRQKYLFFEKHCSEVSPGLFLSGDYVAKNRDILRQAGVSHVLNCVGFICKEYFKDELTYKTLFLQGGPAQTCRGQVAPATAAPEAVQRAMTANGMSALLNVHPHHGVRLRSHRYAGGGHHLRLVR